MCVYLLVVCDCLCLCDVLLVFLMCLYEFPMLFECCSHVSVKVFPVFLNNVFMIGVCVRIVFVLRFSYNCHTALRRLSCCCKKKGAYLCVYDCIKLCV